MKARKILIFSATYGHFLRDTMSSKVCQIKPIDANFHLKKSTEIFDKNSAGRQNLVQKGLMPIRVKFECVMDFIIFKIK
jgi:hypothetical protein